MSAGGFIAQALLGGTQGAAQGIGNKIREEAKLKRQQALEETRTENRMQEQAQAAELGAKAPTDAARKSNELIEAGVDEDQARNAAYGMAPEKNKPLTINDQLIDPETGEVLGDYRDPESRSGKGSDAPADVRTAEWMVANGMAPNLDVAFNRVNESRTDPARFVNDFVTQEMKFQEASGIFPGNENYREPEQMREQAVETLQMIRSRTRGNGSEPQADASAPAPKGLIMTASEAEELPKDGSAVQQEDGSYTGRVNRNPEQAPQQTAPPAAIEYLRKNPGMASQFREKYGYIPEGF